MARILTVVGEIDIWEGKSAELQKVEYNLDKRRVLLLFLVRDESGDTYSTDKLKMYGVKNLESIVKSIEKIRSHIKAIDLHKTDQIALLDKSDKTILEISLDKHQFNSDRVL